VGNSNREGPTHKGKERDEYEEWGGKKMNKKIDNGPEQKREKGSKTQILKNS